jgi:hypothetical protein
MKKQTAQEIMNEYLNAPPSLDTLHACRPMRPFYQRATGRFRMVRVEGDRYKNNFNTRYRLAAGDTEEDVYVRR